MGNTFEVAGHGFKKSVFAVLHEAPIVLRSIGRLKMSWACVRHINLSLSPARKTTNPVVMHANPMVPDAALHQQEGRTREHHLSVTSMDFCIQLSKLNLRVHARV